MLLIALVAAMAFSPATPAKNKGCTPVQTRALIIGFVNAFNRSDSQTLNRVWDSKDWFKWYSVSNAPGIRIKADAYRRDTLLPYFAARHAAHERLVLTSLRIGSYSYGYRNFQCKLTRSADDLPGSPVAYEGKARRVASPAASTSGAWAAAASRVCESPRARLRPTTARRS